MDELKSRYAELYPPHTCPTCRLEHTYIPPMSMTVKVQEEGEDKEVKVPFIPFELVGVMSGPYDPGGKVDSMDVAPVHVYGLLWARLGAPQPEHQSMLFMN